MPFFVGTSGWQYKDWKGAFYPAKLPTAGWLDFYATKFAMVEVNNTFYRLPERKTFEHWADAATPHPLQYVIKASRYLTHVRRLTDPLDPVELLLDRAEPIRPRMPAVLVQLPPTLHAEPGRLDATLAAFGRHQVRVVVEPREASWFGDESLRVLRDHGAALCWTDRRGRIGPTEQTADWGYVRLHEGQARGGSYGRQALSAWADRLDEAWPDDGTDVIVAFNNDPGAAAPHNAETLIRELRRRGREAPGGR